MAKYRLSLQPANQSEPPESATETNHGISLKSSQKGSLWFGIKNRDPPTPREIAGFFGEVANSY